VVRVPVTMTAAHDCPPNLTTRFVPTSGLAAAVGALVRIALSGGTLAEVLGDVADAERAVGGLAQVDQADGAHRGAVRCDRAQLRDPGRDAGRGLARVERPGRPLQQQVRSRALRGSPTVRPGRQDRSSG